MKLLQEGYGVQIDTDLPAFRNIAVPLHLGQTFREVGLTLEFKVVWFFQTSSTIYQSTRCSISVHLNVYLIHLFYFIRKILTSLMLSESHSWQNYCFVLGIQFLLISVTKASTTSFLLPFQQHTVTDYLQFSANTTCIINFLSTKFIAHSLS